MNNRICQKSNKCKLAQTDFYTQIFVFEISNSLPLGPYTVVHLPKAAALPG